MFIFLAAEYHRPTFDQ